MTLKIKNSTIILALMVYSTVYSVLAIFGAVSFIGWIFSLPLLFCVPGYFISRLLTVRDQSPSDKFVQIVGLSVIYYMVIGLLINGLYPFLGNPEPLSIDSTIISFSVLTLFLGSMAYFVSNKSYYHFSILHANLPFFLLGLFIIFLGVIGPLLLNNTNHNALVLLLLFTISLVAVLCLITESLSDGLYSYLIFCMALSLLFIYSLRSNYVVGYDINQELQVFKLTLENSFWNIETFRDAYNACLSITILPTIYKNYTGLPNDFVFKIIFQIIFAIVPVIIFLITKTFLNKQLSFVAAFLFISQVWYSQQMPSLIRQQVALFFFSLVIYVIFSLKSPQKLKNILFSIFGIGMILSHYSTTYIALFLLIVVYFGSLTVRKFFNSELQEGKVKFLPLITLIIVTFFWNGVITRTSENLSKVGNDTLTNINESMHYDSIFRTFQEVFFVKKNENAQSLLTQYSITTPQNYFAERTYLNYYSPDSYKDFQLVSIEFQPIAKQFGIIVYNFGQQIFQITKLLINNIFILFGLLFLLIRKYQKDSVNYQYRFLIVLSVVILGFFLVSPVLGISYNLSRLYLQLFIFLSLASVVGGFGILNRFLSIKLSTLCLILICNIYFLFYAGAVNQFIGGKPSVTLNNFGEDFEKLYTYDSDVKAAEFLGSIYVDETVYTNAPGRNKLWAYANIRRINYDTLPSVIDKNSFVYATYSNTVNNIALASFKERVIAYEFPSEFLDQNKDRIYSNGYAEVFK